MIKADVELAGVLTVSSPNSGTCLSKSAILSDGTDAAAKNFLSMTSATDLVYNALLLLNANTIASWVQRSVMAQAANRMDNDGSTGGLIAVLLDVRSLRC